MLEKTVFNMSIETYVYVIYANIITLLFMTIIYFFNKRLILGDVMIWYMITSGLMLWIPFTQILLIPLSFILSTVLK